MRRIDTSRPGAADHGGPPLADGADKSSPGLSGTTWSLEPIFEQEDSSLLADVTLDVLAVPPPHGLDGRQRCKFIKDFCCALVYLHSQVPQVVHGASEIPVPLLRPHGIGVSISSG